MPQRTSLSKMDLMSDKPIIAPSFSFVGRPQPRRTIVLGTLLTINHSVNSLRILLWRSSIMSSAMKGCIPPSLQVELKKHKIDFDAVHAILMTHTSDVGGAAAAALITSSKSLNVMDIMKKAGFLDWSFPTALDMLQHCHRLSTIVPPEFFSVWIPKMKTVVETAVTEYKYFCDLFTKSKLHTTLTSRHLVAAWKLALIARLEPSSAGSHQVASEAAIAFFREIFGIPSEANNNSIQCMEGVEATLASIRAMMNGPAHTGASASDHIIHTIDILYADTVPLKDAPLDLSQLAIDENIDYFLPEETVVTAQQQQSVRPILFSDAMELSEWIIANAFRDQVPVPRDPVDTGFVERCIRNLIEDAEVTIPNSGFVRVRNFGCDGEIAKAIIAVYFSIIGNEQAMTIATAVVLKAMSTNSRLHKNVPEMQLYKILEATECNTVKLLNCTDDVKPSLPRSLREELNNIEINVMDSLIWIKDGALAEMMEGLPEGFWPPPSLASEPSSETESSRDWAMIVCVFSKVTTMIKERLIEFVKVLGLESYMFIPFYETCRYCLREHMDLVWDRHIDHIILCSVYGVCRTCQFDLKFADILDAYVRLRQGFLGAATCNRIARHIVVDNQVGNIITFYNKAFVPQLKTYLLEDPTLQKYVEKRNKQQSMHPS